MVKLVKIRYISGKNAGFEHVMKEVLARVLEKRGQVEILPDAPAKAPKVHKRMKLEELQRIAQERGLKDYQDLSAEELFELLKE